MTPTCFETAAAFRRWLRAHHRTAAELWVGFLKASAGGRSITYAEARDEALCVGWIDGLRRRLDDARYVIRFTPRRPGSIWSQVNLARMRALEAEGRVTAAGRAVFERRDPAMSVRYSFERAHVALDPAYEHQLKANRAAWAFFEAQPPSYRKPVTWWVMSAKQEATRQRRLAILIADSTKGLRIEGMRRPEPGSRL